MLKRLTIASTAALFAAGALAQEAALEDVTEISAWNYDALYEMEGFRGDALLDADVYGEDGEEIGEVENVILDGAQAVALLVETGGFLDIGDRHLVVPWDEVAFVDGGLAIPVVEENLDDYDIWNDGTVVSRALDEIKVADDGAVAPTPTLYRLSDLLSDYVTAAGAGFGYIDDVIMDRDGEIQAVVTTSRAGYYATPYYGPAYGYTPYAGAYEIGYGADEIGGLAPFEHGEVNDDWW